MAVKKKTEKKPAKAALKNLKPKKTSKVKSVAPRTVACLTPPVNPIKYNPDPRHRRDDQ